MSRAGAQLRVRRMRRHMEFEVWNAGGTLQVHTEDSGGVTRLE